ncbi:MAG: hypothetical protein ACLFPJ_01730 [Candidatus Woesearchaeota archaeon]
MLFTFKKSQASFEYMLVVGIMFFGILGAVSFLIYYQQSAEDEVSAEQISFIAEKINEVTTEAFYTTGIFKKEISYQIPKSILNIFTYNNTKETYSFIVFESINQNFTYALNTVVCANVTREVISTGRIIVEKGFNDKHVSLCTTVDVDEKCVCEFN